MTTERSDKLFEAAREAQVKFDYFVLGVVGALCAYIVQAFHPARLGLNPSTVELLSLLLFAGAAITGFRRIESVNSLMRINSQYLRMQEERGSLTPTLGSPVLNHSTGDVYSPDQVAARVEALGDVIPKALADMERVGKTTLRMYKWRNWLLLSGFLVLLASRVWSAYV